MPTSQRMFIPFQQLFTDLGAIGAGWKIYTYETLTTTPKVTYTTPALNVANTNPVVADSAGRLASMFVSRTNLYKAVLTDENDVVIQTRDPVDSLSFSLADFNPQPTSFWGTTAGTSSAYTLNPSNPVISAYSSNNTFFIIFHTANAAGATLTIDGLAARTLQKETGQGTLVDLLAGDVQNGVYILKDNGVTFTVINPQIPFLSGRNITQAVTKVTIANNVADANNDINFSAGTFQFSDGTGFASLSAITKRLDASWAVGTGNGGLDTGAKANSTWYYCYAIYNPTTAISDAIFTATFGSPTLPSGYTKTRYVGTIKTDSGGNILGFTQLGDWFIWNARIADLVTTSPATTKTNLTISVPPSISCMAKMVWHSNDESEVLLRIFGVNETDAAPSTDNNDFMSMAATVITGELQRLTNTGIISYRSSNNTVNDLSCRTQGWQDLSL